MRPNEWGGPERPPQAPVSSRNATVESVADGANGKRHRGSPFEDWSEDLPATYGDVTAAQVNRQQVELPSERHVTLYRLLRSTSHYDQAGRLVSWWPQQALAARLDVSIRTVRNLLADLREPGLDPRHPRGKPPGLRLGVVRVEPTTYRDRSTGKHRLGGNLYVLIEHGQQATPAEPVSAAQVNRQEDPVACLNKEPPATEEREVGSSRVSSSRVSSSRAPAALPPVRYRGRRLTGTLAEFHAGVDQLDRDSCSDGHRCQQGYRCRRHTRRSQRRAS